MKAYSPYMDWLPQSQDCWVIIHGVVYDVTAFAAEHPGGPELLTEWAGAAATEAFADAHPEGVAKIAETLGPAGLAAARKGLAGAKKAKAPTQARTKRKPRAAAPKQQPPDVARLLACAVLLGVAGAVLGAAIATISNAVTKRRERK